MNTCNGIRIAMAGIGDADAILVMSWTNGVQTNTLIDAGTKSDYPTVKGMLNDFGVSHLHHVVNSHPHADHQGGLIELATDAQISIGAAWMHLPWQYLDYTSFRQVLSQAGERRRAKQLRDAFESSITLYNLFVKGRKLQPFQPFTGQTIGPFVVVGPTEQFYRDQLHQFDELSEIIADDEWRKQQDAQDELAEFAERINMGIDLSPSLEANPKTEAENNTSTLLAAKVEGKVVLLTADAGAPALLEAASAYPLEECEFMQIPHHGSRHNISPFLIHHLRPKTAFVSAVGNKKHPRMSVVNAFKSAGADVYSTHYPKALGIVQSYGVCPPSPWNGIASPLWDSPLE